eukprot:12401096-Karenia_brevis.AAC.1
MTPLAKAPSKQETPEERRVRLTQNLARVKERRGYVQESQPTAKTRADSQPSWTKPSSSVRRVRSERPMPHHY